MSQSAAARVPDTLITERLILLAPRIEHAAELNAAVRESLESLRPWMHWAQRPPELEETEQRVRKLAERFGAGTDYSFYGFRRDSGRLAVVVGLHPMEPTVPSYQIGYWCRQSEQGRGYTTEACREVTRFALEIVGARRVDLCCDPRNAGSRRVAEKVGYTFEGELRNEQRRPDGTLRNTLVFSITRDDEGETTTT